MPTSSNLRSTRTIGPVAAAVLGLALTIVAGCGTTPPTPSPSAAGTASLAATASPTATTSPQATASPTPTPTASPSATPTPSDPPIAKADRHWYQVAVADNAGTDLFGPAYMSAAAALSDGFIAVGNGPSGGIDWTSPDGRSWKRTEFPSKVLRNARLAALAVGTDQIVAAGSISSLTGTSRPALWATASGPDWSLVGGSWSLVADPAGGTAAAGSATDAGTMVGVVNTPSGFVAVGSIAQKAYAWRSADGLTWSAPIAFPNAANVDLWQLVAGPAGLLASGESFGSDGWHPVTWLSTDDGRTWTDASFPTANLDSVTVDRDGYWAFGWNPAPDGSDSLPHSVLRSTDGIQWQPVGALPLGAVNSAVVVPTSTGGMLVVVIPADEQTGRAAAVYSSRDAGGAWTKEVPADSHASDPGNALALVATDHSILAVGSASDRPAAWLATPGGVAPPGAPPKPVTHPAGWCPSGAVDLPTILSLSQADRLRCYGTRTIHLPAFIVQPEGLGGTCGCTATPAWLTGRGLGYPAAWLAPLDVPFGQTDSLPAFARPSVKGATPTLRWVSVTGHFDDPASTTCRIRNLDGSLQDPIAKSVAKCRQSFVATAIATIQPPDPTAGLRIGAPYLVEPNDGGIDGVPPEVVALGLADVWQDGTPVATILVFRTALSPTATKAFATRIAKARGAPDRRLILGISVAFYPDGAVVFTLGHRTFMITGGGSSDPTRATLQAIATSLIRSNR